MNIDACVFDLDGTLINSLGDIADSANWALAQFGLPAHTEAEYRYFVGNGARLLIEHALPGNRRDETTLDTVYDAYRERYQAHTLNRTRPYDGIPALLRSLARRRLRLAVVSNKPDSDSRAIVSALFPDAPFSFVAGHRDGAPHKPDPAVVLEACAAMGVQPAHAVMLGDSSVDIQTGVNGGLVPVGALWGFRDEAELRAAGARFLITRPAQLLEIIRRV